MLYVVCIVYTTNIASLRKQLWNRVHAAKIVQEDSKQSTASFPILEFMESNAKSCRIHIHCNILPKSLEIYLRCAFGHQKPALWLPHHAHKSPVVTRTLYWYCEGQLHCPCCRYLLGTFLRWGVSIGNTNREYLFNIVMNNISYIIYRYHY